MIKFVWKHKYRLLSLIILCFIFSIYTLKNPKIFYDSERILKYAEDLEIEKKEIDDSIHIITSYRFNILRGVNKKEAIDKSLRVTGKAVIKTTLIIIVTLVPLLFSEFNSISQLGLLTIVSAIIAIVFDLIYLPKLIRYFL